LLVAFEKKLEAGLKFAQVFFAQCNLACYSPKFSPAKILCYTVFFSARFWKKKIEHPTLTETLYTAGNSIVCVYNYCKQLTLSAGRCARCRGLGRFIGPGDT